MEKAPDAKNWFGPKTVEEFVPAAADRVLLRFGGPGTGRAEPRRNEKAEGEESAGGRGGQVGAHLCLTFLTNKLPEMHGNCDELLGDLSVTPISVMTSFRLRIWQDRLVVKFPDEGVIRERCRGFRRL